MWQKVPWIEYNTKHVKSFMSKHLYCVISCCAPRSHWEWSAREQGPSVSRDSVTCSMTVQQRGCLPTGGRGHSGGSRTLIAASHMFALCWTVCTICQCHLRIHRDWWWLISFKKFSQTEITNKALTKDFLVVSNFIFIFSCISFFIAFWHDHVIQISSEILDDFCWIHEVASHCNTWSRCLTLALMEQIWLILYLTCPGY